jgi:hypothetical protein
VTVYIDDMHRYPMGRFGRMKMSHMIADTEDELHAMAARIGIARKWHQGDHYDVSKSRRELAIQYGAKPVTMRELAAMCFHRRKTGKLGEPTQAVNLQLAFLAGPSSLEA